MLGTSRIARLDSKHEHIRQTLLDMSSGVESPQSGGGRGVPTPGLLHSPIAKPPRRKRIGRLQMNGQPKLFGGSLEEYLESLNLEIPLIIKSCIRVINLYGKSGQQLVGALSRVCKLILWYANSRRGKIEYEIWILRNIRAYYHFISQL